jgi:hypothetical protein
VLPLLLLAVVGLQVCQQARAGACCTAAASKPPQGRLQRMVQPASCPTQLWHIPRFWDPAAVEAASSRLLQVLLLVMPAGLWVGQQAAAAVSIPPQGPPQGMSRGCRGFVLQALVESAHSCKAGMA